MQEQTLIIRFLICLVILATIKTVQCGLMNEKLKKLIKQSEDRRISTTAPTTSIENIVLNDEFAADFSGRRTTANQVPTKQNKTYTLNNDMSAIATNNGTKPKLNETDRATMSFNNVSNDDTVESTSTPKVKTTVNTTLAEENRVYSTESPNNNVSENNTTTPTNTTIIKDMVNTNESPTDTPDITNNIIPENNSAESTLATMTTPVANTTPTEQNNIEIDELSNNNVPGDNTDDTTPTSAMTTINVALTEQNKTDETQLLNTSVPVTDRASSTRPTTTTLTEAARTTQRNVVLPNCKRSGTYMVDALMDECYYLKCNVASRKYQREKCPASKAVPPYYMKSKKRRKKEYRYVPCIKPSTTCRGQKPVIEPPPKRKCGIDLVFAVDVSCSITDPNKKRIQKFLMDIAEVLKIGPEVTRIGIISFAKKIYHVAFLNNTDSNKFLYRGIVKQMDLVLKKDRNQRQDCGTATDEALKSVRLEYFTPKGGDRPDKQNVLVVLSDGLTVPTENKNKTISEAQKIKEMKIPCFVMGLPNQRQMDQGSSNIYIGDEEWYAIASAPENVFKMDFNEMSRKIAFIVDQVHCSEEERRPFR